MNNEDLENLRILNSKNNKKANLTNKSRKNICQNINKFMNKTKYDTQIFSDSTDEIFIKFITLLNDTELIDSFSEETVKEYNDIYDNDFKVDRNGIDFDIGDRLGNYKDYRKNKEEKYKSEIEYFLSIFEILKSEEFTQMKDDVNMVINEEDENVENFEEESEKNRKSGRGRNSGGDSNNNLNNINGKLIFLNFFF